MNHYNKKGTIEGLITDSSSGKPLYGVNINVDGKDMSARTDIRGRFTLPNVASGKCALSCHLEGYKPALGLTAKIAHGSVSKCDCQLVSKGKISLNEPVVMLPLRLEIRKHSLPERINPSVTKIAKYSPRAGTKFATSSRKFSPFEVKSQIEPHNVEANEYWIRWYPDDIHHLTPVGKVTDEEKIAWGKFYTVYERHKDLGSVKGLYTQDRFNLSLELLEIFYGINSGRLTDDEIARCKTYDEAARQFIIDERVGVREALGWQDTGNPKIKSAWIEFAKAFSPVRARQIAKAALDENWDFDTDNAEEDPIDILMDQGISLHTLPEEISIYTIKDSKLELLVDDITINRGNLIVAPDELEGALWMTDFEKAVEAGMGIIINDQKKTIQIDQADWLIVVGLNDTPESRNILEEILRRNNANGELAILAQDSPTNNTESTTTSYTGLEVDAEEYLRKTRIRIPTGNYPQNLSDQLSQNSLDAHKLTNIFKLSNSTLSEMPDADLSEMIDAGAMAALLWTPCTLLFEKTWGKEFRQHFHADPQVSANFSLGNFFIQNVRARGTLPILRVGENPYGILPVISLRDWCKHLSSHKDIAGQGTDMFCAFINSLKETFLEYSNDSHSVNQDDDEVYEKLLEMLRLSPVSKRVDVRAFDSKKPYEMSEDPEYLNCPLVKEKVAKSDEIAETPYPETAYLDNLSRINRTDFNPACFHIDENSPLLKRIIKHLLWLIFDEANEPSKCKVKGKVVDKVTGKTLPNTIVKVRGGESTTETDERGEFTISNLPAGVHDLEILHPDYTEFRSVNVDVSPHLHNEIEFKLSPTINTKSHISGKYPPENKASNKPTKTVIGKVIDRKSGKVIEGAHVHLKGTGRSALTDSKGEYTIDHLPVGDHQLVTSTTGYDTTTFSVSIKELSPVLEVSSSLVPVIENTKGHSDAAATGIKIPGGLKLIAEAANLLKRLHPDKVEILLVETLDLLSHRLDAWLTGIANSQLMVCQKENTQSPPIGIYGWLEKPGELDTTPPKPEFIQAPSVKQATTAAILRNASIHNGTDDNSGAFQVNLSSAQIRKGRWYLEGLRQGHLPGEILGYQLERLIHDASRKETSEIKDDDIFYLREKYPLEFNRNKDEVDKSPSILTIIDGEKFLDDKDNQELDSKYFNITNQINQIKDAATDIAVCEVVNADDNVARRGGWLDFLDGQCLPPAEEFIQSQRTGDIHGTKVFLQISSPDNLTADESVTNPRVIADPILAHFCETLIPDFGSKEIVVELTNVKVKQSRPITIFTRELNMDAIDLVMGGIEELRLRIRYYLLSCWKINDLTDTTITHPCNILGPFPDFGKSDDLLNEIGIEITPPLSSSDTISVFTCIEKAKLIRNLIHQNRSKKSLGTVHPKELSIVAPDQLEKLDPLASIELLSKRLRRIQDQLIKLISKTVRATSELKRRHITAQGLQECKKSILRLKETIQSSENETSTNDSIDLFTAKIIHLLESDTDFKDLADGVQIRDQINQIKNGDNNISENIEALRVQLLNLENKFNLFIESSAKALVSNPNIPLFEIGQFGLEKALSIFPDDPTVADSVEIVRLFDQLVAALIEKFNALIVDSSDLQNHMQCLKVIYLNGAEIDQILHLTRDSQAIANKQLRNRLPLTEAQSQIILAKEIQIASNFEPLLNSLLDNINSLSKIATYYEDYLVSTKIVLIDDPKGVYNIVKNSTSDALERLVNSYQITEKQAEIILGLKLEDIDDFDDTHIREEVVSTTNSKIPEVISLLQTATDLEGMVIFTPYLLSRNNSLRPEWNLDYSLLVGLPGPTYLQEYQQVRPAIANLYKLFNVGKELVIYEDKHYQRLDPTALAYKKEGNTDYLYLTKNGESEGKENCLAFILLDQWQEGIPNPDQSEMTGVALRYETPQAEAPNAVLIAVPPFRSNTEYWSMDLLANTILETLELMQIRMMDNSEGVGNLGQWLPTLLFGPNKDGSPLFPSRERFLHDFDIGSNPGYVLTSQLSSAELLKTEVPTIRNETPKTRGNYEE